MTLINREINLWLCLITSELGAHPLNVLQDPNVEERSWPMASRHRLAAILSSCPIDRLIVWHSKCHGPDCDEEALAPCRLFCLTIEVD